MHAWEKENVFDNLTFTENHKTRYENPHLLDLKTGLLRKTASCKIES